ncbi:hypothetical protein C5167_049273 [Papaver somniferum]|uniref:Uncharacterized protein n=1 Tax=Papaver somniferum TaxID=3469 RepID=A0A4Y7KKC9_PAPSO|nr:hypothetical protein C5167_049273 [Papaver somniferum]
MVFMNVQTNMLPDYLASPTLPKCSVEREISLKKFKRWRIFVKALESSSNVEFGSGLIPKQMAINNPCSILTVDFLFKLTSSEHKSPVSSPNDS